MESISPLGLLVGLVLLIPPMLFLGRRGTRFGATPTFSWWAASWRAIAWSLPVCWTLVLGGVGHGAGAGPLPSWLVLLEAVWYGSKGLDVVAPALWVSPALPVLTYLTFALQSRGRATNAPWA